METKQPRPLSHDEKKAAEAAYQGKPFHSSWSKSARSVYDGILQARGVSPEAMETLDLEADLIEIQANAPEVEVQQEPCDGEACHNEYTAIAEPAPQSFTQQITSRQEAIAAGLLIDVSNKAKKIGFNLAVGITKSLWNRSISQSSENETSEGESRVRDMLLAVRLRLASLDSPSPWVEVPVLFPSQQDEKTAKIFPIYALFHKDPVAEECLTLIHPKELTSIRPSTHTNAEEEPSSSDLS